MNQTYLDEDQLLECFAQNDKKAAEQIYKLNYKLVSAFIKSRGGSSDEVDDFFQDAMTVLYQKSQEKDFRLTCKISTYLIAISKHLWFKKLNTQRTVSDLLFIDSDGEEQSGLDNIAYEDDIQQFHEKEIDYNMLQKSLLDLGDPCKKLILLFYNEKLSMQDITKIMGYTNPENTKTQKYKCLNRLKKIFFTSKNGKEK